jgi:membrane protease YdiL (CAAX protease family)
MTPFWTFGDLAFLLLAYVPLSAIAISLAGKSDAAKLLAQIAAYVAWFGVMALLFRAKYGKPFWRSLGWVRATTLAWAVPLGVAVMLGSVALMRWLDLRGLESPVRRLLEDPKTLPLTVAAVVVAGPVAEELFFRGFLQPLLVRASGAIAGILLTGAAFGMLHFPQSGGRWGQVAIIALAGCVFGVARYWSGSTIAAAGMHMAYNGSLVTAYFWEKMHG